MSLIRPSNSRGPILNLALPPSEKDISLILRNKTIAKTLTINLPAGWAGADLSLDFYRRTITEASGADRSAFLDPTDSGLWLAAPIVAGANDIEIEALGDVTLVALDDFNQSSGVLTGKSAEKGGTYQTLSGSDSSDFQIVEGGHLVERDVFGDAGSLGNPEPEVLGSLLKGRAVGLPLSIGPTRATLTIGVPETAPVGAFGLLTRVADNKNFVILWGNIGFGELHLKVHILEKGVGVKTFAYSGPSPGEAIGLMVDIVGKKLSVRAGAPGSEDTVISGEHALLGGALAKGGAYMYHEYEGPESDNGSYTYDRLRVYEIPSLPYVATATLRWEKGYY